VRHYSYTNQRNNIGPGSGPPGASEMSKDVSGWVPAAGAEVTIVDANGVSHTVTTDENGLKTE